MSAYIEKPRAVCALGGAIATVNALPRTVAILHSSQGCGGNLANAVNPGAGHMGTSYMGGVAIPCSGILENEIVFGGTERLDEQIAATVEVVDADLYLVLTGCQAEMIGDDFESIATRHRSEGKPVFAVSTAGFKGSSLLGYDLVLETLVQQYVVRGLPQKPGTVNLFGIPPAQDPFWAGNLLEIRRLLGRLGLRVNTFFTAEDSLEGIRTSSEAVLNIVVSETYGSSAAEAYRIEHGIPYVKTQFPIGAMATHRFLEEITSVLGLTGALVDELFASEEKYYYGFLSRALDAYGDFDLQRYAVVIGSANTAPALSEFAYRELGWLPELVVVTDILSEQEEQKITESFAARVPELAEKLEFENDPSRIKERFAEHWEPNRGQRYYRAFNPSFVIGSVLDKDFADEFGAGHLAVTFPVSSRFIMDRSIAGYKGGLTLTEDIFSALVSFR